MAGACRSHGVAPGADAPFSGRARRALAGLAVIATARSD
jgi:hypothetical protein